MLNLRSRYAQSARYLKSDGEKGQYNAGNEKPYGKGTVKQGLDPISPIDKQCPTEIRLHHRGDQKRNN